MTHDDMQPPDVEEHFDEPREPDQLDQMNEHELRSELRRSLLKLDSALEGGHEMTDRWMRCCEERNALESRLHSARKIITDALGGVEGEIDYGEARAWLDSAPAVETREQSEDERLREVVGTFAAVVERNTPNEIGQPRRCQHGRDGYAQCNLSAGHVGDHEYNLV